MSLTRLALAFAAPIPKIESFRRYLFIGPHPTTLRSAPGATAAKLASSGKELCFLICTDGRYGDGCGSKKAEPGGAGGAAQGGEPQVRRSTGVFVTCASSVSPTGASMRTSSCLRV